MSDTQSTAPSAQAGNLSIAEAAEKFRDQREAQQSNNPSVTTAAGKLAEQREADARLARRAEAAGEVMGGEPEDDGARITPPEMPETAEALPQADSDGVIDLGDGLKVTVDQVREGFMLKADHTRKTQALAEERRALEAIRAQKLAALEQALGQLSSHVSAPKSLQALLAEDPVNGLARFAQQVDRMQQLSAARELARQQRHEHFSSARAERDRHLAEGYWTSRSEAEKGVADALSYAKSYGYGDDYLADALADPQVVTILDKARKFDELQAGRARIERMVADKPKVVKPGARVSVQAAHQSAVQGARSKLKSSGSLSDAIAYLQAQRKAKGG